MATKEIGGRAWLSANVGSGSRGESMGMGRIWTDFWKDEAGATTIEYVLIIVIVSVGIIGAAKGITAALDGMIGDVRDSF